MKVTVLPYKGPRKHRKQETHVTTVKWIEGNMLKFQVFKRDNAAMEFVDKLTTLGVNPADIAIKMS